MIYLDTTTEKLEVVLGGAKTTNDCNYYASFYDIPRQKIDGGQEFPGGNKYGNTNGTTAVTLVASPNQAISRAIPYLSVHNKDTVSTTVTVRLHDGSSSYILCKKALSADQTLVYNSKGGGWLTI